jgi:hypothetical protein
VVATKVGGVAPIARGHSTHGRREHHNKEVGQHVAALKRCGGTWLRPGLLVLLRPGEVSERHGHGAWHARILTHGCMAASSAGWVCVIAFIESYGQSLYDDIAFVLLLTKFCSSSAQRHELAEIY